MKQAITLTYYANVKQKSNGYIISFRDFDNIFSEGDTLPEALHNAQEALDGTLAEMAKADYVVKLPTSGKTGEYPITVSPDIAAPILLYLLRKQRTKTLSYVAKAMHVPYQQYQRLEHNCNMTLKSLKKAVAAMGGRIELTVHLDDKLA